jgi:hypothetical protein
MGGNAAQPNLHRGHKPTARRFLKQGAGRIMASIPTSERVHTPHHVRCSCGALHPRDAFKPIGRQYGRGGGFVDLANCPTCGSTISLEPPEHSEDGDDDEEPCPPTVRCPRFDGLVA